MKIYTLTLANKQGKVLSHMQIGVCDNEKELEHQEEHGTMSILILKDEIKYPIEKGRRGIDELIKIIGNEM